MKFKERLLQGALIKRYKRFFVDIKYQNKVITAHCPNSGSMMGLLKADNIVWFSESNKILSNFPGFVSRRFLKSPDGSYRIIVEHESKETFVKMHQSPEHEKLHPTGHSFMSADPVRKTFNVAAE